MIHLGDNLEIMKRSPSESIDLIATDPPFGTERDWGAYDDRWSGLDNYLAFMKPRLEQMHRLLKPTGSLYLHCDPTASHYLKVELDRIFGRSNFRNEIVWCYKGPSKTRRWFPRKHDSILFYSKTDKNKFNPDEVRVPYIEIPRAMENDVSYAASKNRSAQSRQKSIDELVSKGGKVVEDWWTDIGAGGHMSNKERRGYPTQKPLALYDRIVKASSDPGDVVLDPFCGSGTTLVAAMTLGRRYIGIDDSRDAVKVAQARINDELE